MITCCRALCLLLHTFIIFILPNCLRVRQLINVWLAIPRTSVSAPLIYPTCSTIVITISLLVWPLVGCSTRTICIWFTYRFLWTSHSLLFLLIRTWRPLITLWLRIIALRTIRYSGHICQINSNKQSLSESIYEWRPITYKKLLLIFIGYWSKLKKFLLLHYVRCMKILIRMASTFWETGLHRKVLKTIT